MDQNILTFLLCFKTFPFNLYVKDIATNILRIYKIIIKQTFEKMLTVDLNFFSNTINNMDILKDILKLVDNNGNNFCHFSVALNNERFVKKILY